MSFPWKKVLCPVDFSEPARGAMASAVQIARHLDADLVLFHAYQLPGYTLPEGSVVASPRMLQELSDRAEAHLAEWKALAEAQGAPRVATEKGIGEPALQIVHAARELGCDAIVLGTHGRTGLAHAILGSTAEQVVRRAACPVVTVRSGSAA
ncbi:universal stress protein [Anaeromyxobacter paludicola]|uniref:UspA domain-containing protein n=1 Tax=Anaeromyxobacter paludicola TaxID=2918171 RepID=A0ABM7XFN5_9BACT|nr:universal stress protein [Anaeromyxobacter paludicola]BDG10722.1 hypothetical protein AMPC_38350 [Anaeromyxobacter paludicola]